MGILPTKGLEPLPLMSYGGGSNDDYVLRSWPLLFRVQSEVAEINANTPKERSK